jgi:hypothetical protein
MKRTPGGKWSWMMKAAVRVVNVCSSLEKYDAVPAFASAVATASSVPACCESRPVIR